MSRKKKQIGAAPIWQTTERVDHTGATTRVMVGGRQIGKTTCCRSIMIDTAASGRRFIYMRKNHSMVTWRKNATLFVKHDDECIKKLGGVIDFPQGKMAFVNTATDEVIGWAVALEDAYILKGTEFPGVKTIFFDEFLDDAPIPDEFALYQNIVSTITRMSDDVVIYMASNTVVRDNVYFRNFGVDISRLKPGDVAVVNHALGATVAVEYCRANPFVNPETGRVANKYVGFDNSPETRMILFGEWTHPPIETREIDGFTWASDRVVFPVLVYIQGSFFEMSVSLAGEVAFVRKINSDKDHIGQNVRKIVTSEFNNTFHRADGSIVPKYLTFASTGNENLLEGVRLFKRFRQAGRVIGIEPVDTHDFLRFFDSMPL